MTKTFDAVAWMRGRRLEIDHEDAKLTWEEKRERTRHLLQQDPLWQRLRHRLNLPPASSETPSGTDDVGNAA